MFKKFVFVTLGLALSLAACAPAAPATGDMMDESATEAMTEASHSGDTMDPTEAMTEEMMAHPDWYGVTFTDARTGMEFSIDGFAGKVILVETLAMWCPNCRSQQQQVAALHESLGMRDDFVSIGLDIDPNEVGGDLANYVESNGFDWYYAVATPDVAREIGQLYGDQFLSPPSTPMLIIDRHGEAHPLPFGIKSADDLLQYLTPYLNEGM